MIIKKLAVPFINDKLLQQVEHVTIATAALSEAGFDFIRSRIPTKTKMEIVTGLDVPTAPEVLRRIWRNYQGRISLNIYTRNVFHANVYIFDLPYRKAVAFIGSGHCTLEGIKDSEELFYKITDAKEIENLKSWFVGYYEFGEPLNENFITAYEKLYPRLKQRDFNSKQDKKEIFTLNTAGFHWDQLKLKHHFFQKEDYQVLDPANARLTSPNVHDARVVLQNKLLQLHELIRGHVQRLQLVADASNLVSSVQVVDHHDQQVRSMWFTYSVSGTVATEGMQLQFIVRSATAGVSLVIGNPNSVQRDREYFKLKMNDVEYRKQFFSLLKVFDPGYTMVVACESKPLDSFANEDAVWEFTRADQWQDYAFYLEKKFTPAAAEISKDNIAATLKHAFDKLVLIARHMKQP